MELTVDQVVSQMGEVYRPSIQALFQGVSQKDLENLVHLNPRANPEIERMNFVGCLRSMGYLVRQHGRGPTSTYQITGWEPRDDTRESIRYWPDDRLRVLDELQSLPRVLSTDWETFYQDQSSRDFSGPLPHSISWLVVWSYLISRREAFWVRTSTLSAILVRRFREKPRWQVVYVSGSLQDLRDLVVRVSSVSLRAVTIFGLQDREAQEFCQLSPGVVMTEREAVYDLDRVLSNLFEVFNSRGLRQLRARERECFLRDPDVELSRRVVDIWREFNEPKQRQLAVVRDYLALESPAPKEWFLGVRDNFPVSVILAERWPRDPTYAFEIVSKGLNYTSMPGGKPGVSDWSTVKEFECLRDRGVRYLNAGSIDGGTDGLRTHKSRFTFGECQRTPRVISKEAFYVPRDS